MLQIKKFVFNPVGVNTYVLSNENGQCAIVDCGCWTESEWKELKGYLTSEHLTPVQLLNTHFHLDHVFGNKYMLRDYGLKPRGSASDYPIYDTLHSQVAMFFGNRIADKIDYDFSKERGQALYDGEVISLGNDQIQVLETPGHSPGGVCFYSNPDHFVISGDTLFQSSIGRTDLEGGNYKTLIQSIQAKLYTLPDDTVVYPGHGGRTTIGDEKAYNPFVGTNTY